MSGAAWNYSAPFTYDGTEKSVEVTGLPPGVTVASYEGNTATKTGTYIAHVTFAYDERNYNEPSIADCSWSILLPPEIRNVTAQQRWPWNGKVDISFDVVGDVEAGLPAETYVALMITATNRVDGANYVASITALSGDTGTAAGAHRVTWDLGAQVLSFESADMVFSVGYVEVPKPYCVIDLSGGANAVSYPVSYLADVPLGGWTDEYKTTNKWQVIIHGNSRAIYHLPDHPHQDRKGKNYSSSANNYR